ncbi:MAG: aspartate-semialdehyde dehydrogenase [Candidatus Krumholzibacteria bacterium]|nr:aspartate-semialdehyde dehydrogenase [Candidatus Krumholzibacteria bacterium]
MDPRNVTEELYGRLKRGGFRGFDPYDGLGSRVFRMSPFFRSKTCRLVWIQLFKRSPVNLRPAALVPKGRNPKGLALVIRGLADLYRLEGDRARLEDAYDLAGIILSQRAAGREYFCAGYDFFWQAKAFPVPEFTPNMVVSTFAGHAFLDLYGIDGDRRWLEYALGVGRFIEGELTIFESDDAALFGYVPGESAVVHNVNLMGSAFLARLFSVTGEEGYAKRAVKAAAYTLRAQRSDGAWEYGERAHHRWVDNFHTGFNLVSLDTARRCLSTDRFDDAIERGLEYHRRNHFLEDMTPKYYDTSLYPVDIHNFAQGIVTFLTFGRPEEARKLLERAIETMWDGKRHYFYYQKTRLYTNRIDYLRWSQAWMFHALARFASSGKTG